MKNSIDTAFKNNLDLNGNPEQNSKQQDTNSTN